MPGDPDGYPTKDEIADYLEQYAAHFDLPIAMEPGIRSLTRRDGGFPVVTDTGAIVATRPVVLATVTDHLARMAHVEWNRSTGSRSTM